MQNMLNALGRINPVQVPANSLPQQAPQYQPIHQISEEQKKQYMQQFQTMNQQQIDQLNTIFTQAQLNGIEREIIVANLMQKETKEDLFKRLNINEEIFSSVNLSANQKIINAYGQRFGV